MEIPVYTIDAFTNLPFKGNPAAVCPLMHVSKNIRLMYSNVIMQTFSNTYLTSIVGESLSLPTTNFL